MCNQQIVEQAAKKLRDHFIGSKIIVDNVDNGKLPLLEVHITEGTTFVYQIVNLRQVGEEWKFELDLIKDKGVFNGREEKDSKEESDPQDCEEDKRYWIASTAACWSVDEDDEDAE